jgi:hypothetical protein
MEQDSFWDWPFYEHLGRAFRVLVQSRSAGLAPND